MRSTQLLVLWLPGTTVPTNNPIRCEYSETGPRDVETSKKAESENRV